MATPTAASKDDVTPDPTTGRVVLYTLTENDVARVRHDALSTPGLAYGNVPSPGDLVPLIVVRVWSGRQVNGQAFLDGPRTLWVTSAAEGDQPGQWHYPPRV